MTRIFLEQQPQQEEITIEGKEAHHLLHVLRVQVGSEVELFCFSGYRYPAEVVALTRRSVQVAILGSEFTPANYSLDYCLYQGIIKAKNWDWLLQKAMELNLPRLVPLKCDYTAAGDLTAGKAERWEKILVAAAKQCHRNHPLKIGKLQSLDELLANRDSQEVLLFAHCSAEAPPFRMVLESLAASCYQFSKLGIVIGPEGGFSEREVALSQQNSHCRMFSLGANILRSETAALAAISAMEFFFGFANKQEEGNHS